MERERSRRRYGMRRARIVGVLGVLLVVFSETWSARRRERSSPVISGIHAARARQASEPGSTDAATGPMATARTPLVPLAVAAVAAAGVASTASAFAISRAGGEHADPLFWSGLLMIVVPAAAAVAREHVRRAERVALVTLVGLLLYLVKVLHDPFMFTFADEWVHAHNTIEILQANALFSANPLLEATPKYPGLPLVASSFATISGVSAFVAGILAVAIARIVMMLGVFLVLEHASRSSRVAAIGALVYTANPNFLFFSAQFSYESLSLPLAVVAVACVQRWMDRRAATRSYAAFAAIIVAAVIMTHHMTTYALVAFLGAVAASAAILRTTANPWPFAALAAAGATAWLVVVADETRAYLLPVVTAAARSTLATIRGEAETRELFASSGGETGPLWERFVALGSTGVMVVCVLVGAIIVLRRFRGDPVAIVLTTAAAAYLGTLALRFVPESWEVANRASGFLFIGVGLLVALTVLSDRVSLLARAAPIVAAVVVGVLFVGGVVSGWSRDLRLAHPPVALAEGGTQLESQPLAAAAWARSHLRNRHVFAADRANARVLLVRGRQLAVTGQTPNVIDLLESENFQPWMLEMLRENEIEYVLFDRDLHANDPMRGYFLLEQSHRLSVREPLRPGGWRKFERHPLVARVYDSGNVTVYDVRALVHAHAPDARVDSGDG